MRTAERGVLVGIVIAAALALRIGFAALGTVIDPLRADAGQYAQYARNLCEHGVYSLATDVPPAPDSFRSPGYPLVLAACRALGGETGWQALAIALQVALGTATVLLVYRLGRQLVGFAPSLLAAAACALSPHLVVSSVYVLTECVTAFAVALAFWLLNGATSPRRRLAAGAAFGFVVLCNEALVVLPLVAAWALARADRRHAAWFAAVALLPFAAWTLRNQVQPLSLRGSERVTASISHGSYPGMVFRDPRWLGYPYREDPAQPAFGASWSGLIDVLGPRIAAEPGRYLAWYTLAKPVWLWGWPLVQGQDVLVYGVANSPYERQPVMQATHAAMRFVHAPLMIAAAVTAALAVLWRRRVAWQMHALGAAAVVGTLVYLPMIPDPRYLQPLRPLLFVLAAVGLATAAAWATARWRQRGAAPAAPSA